MPDFPYLPLSSISTPSASPSPAPRRIALLTPPRSNLSLLSPSSPLKSLPPADRHRLRKANDTNLGNQAPSAMDLHEHTRTRSGSGSRPVVKAESIAKGVAHLLDPGYYTATCWKRADASHGRNESLVLIG